MIKELLKLAGEALEAINAYVDDPTHRLLARQKIIDALHEIREQMKDETDKEKYNELLNRFTDTISKR